MGAAQLSGESDELVFVTSDAQLLRFAASSVRPQGRAAGGIAGVRLSAGASAVWFGAVDEAAASGSPSGAPGTYSPAVVVTVAGQGGVLPGTAAGSVKITPLHEFPPKGRATGGVRCHRFLKGEEALVMAWAGPAPAVGATEDGSPVILPDPVGKRDGSGIAQDSFLAARRHFRHGIVFVVQGDVVKAVFQLLVHAAYAVLNDHGNLVHVSGIVAVAGGDGTGEHQAVAVLMLQAFPGQAWSFPPCRPS